MKSSLRKIEDLRNSYDWIVADMDDWMEGTTSASLSLLVSGEVVCSKSFPSNDQESRHAIHLTIRETKRLDSLLSTTDDSPQVLFSENVENQWIVTQRCLVIREHGK
ncbi:hypothetical protein SDC9_89027 [bioreactor metagenome]|uniref:Uncharacterized protein n=1 Tax=bioreactor metagenome TaxID=1076179 RepID=A0A644ZNE4_9ZZZZ